MSQMPRSSTVALRDGCGFAGARLNLRFQFRDALLQRRDCVCDFLGGETRRDVFGAVPVECHDVDDEEALDNGLDLFFGQLRNEFRMFAGVFDSSMAENFETVAFGVVDQEQRDTIIRRKVAGGEHLAIAFVICEGELRRTDYTKESRLAAAMLNIGPTVFRDACDVKAVSPGDELDFLRGEQIGWLSVTRTITG